MFLGGTAALATLWLFAASGASSSAADAPSAPASLAGKKIHLAYIVKGKTDVYWKSVEAGAMAAQKDAKAAGIDLTVTFDAPAKDGDSDAQITMVENYIGQSVDGIILAPNDFTGLVPPVEKAKKAKIPVIIVDSELDSKDRVAFVGTNNKHGGEIAGQNLAKVMGDKGNAVLLRFDVKSAACNDREQGFLDEMAKHPNIKLISKDQYAGVTRDTALDKATNLLQSLQGKVDGVFTPNESSTGGMLLALENMKLAGKIKFVGFDGGDFNMTGMKAGHIDGLLIQNPYGMGYQGVNAMLDSLAGKTVPANIDTGATFVTKDNMDTPDVKKLLDSMKQ
jgi:ribose transport system substrate-binding protein